jgi:stearoyl-CoA desaturase (delta-9 desaturase)
VLSKQFEETRLDRIRDFARFPELRWLDRHHFAPSWVLLGTLFLLGGPAAAIWGSFVSTVVLWHGTFTINSLSHVFGSRRYDPATTRGTTLPAAVTLGEDGTTTTTTIRVGHPGLLLVGAGRHLLRLKALSLTGLIWDLREPPAVVRDRVLPASAAAESAR